MDLKTSVASSNDKTVCLGKQREKKKKKARALASSISPFSKDMDVTKCISCSSRGKLKLGFPHPYTEATVRNSCLPENGRTTHYSSTLTTELIHSPGHDADAQCRLPVLYPNNSATYFPKIKKKKKSIEKNLHDTH